jgi:hypothetical protein
LKWVPASDAPFNLPVLERLGPVPWQTGPVFVVRKLSSWASGAASAWVVEALGEAAVVVVV